MTTVVVEGAQEEVPVTQAEVIAADAVEAQADAVEATAEAAVNIAEIEAARDVEIAEITAEVHSEEIAARTSEEQLSECQTQISALTATVENLTTQVALLTQARSDPPPMAELSESDAHEVTPDSQEAPEAPAKRRPRHKWI
jgi:D-alanyl-D-alanine carboxypeptidase